MTFQVIKPVIVRFRDVPQLRDRFEHLSQPSVGLGEAPVGLGEAPVGLGEASFVLREAGLVILVHRDDQFHRLRKRLMAFGQLLQTFIDSHFNMVQACNEPDSGCSCKLSWEETELQKSSVFYAMGGAILLLAGLPPLTLADGPYKVSKVVKAGGEGTYDTAFADVEARRLYIPRKNPGRITVFNLDTLEPVGEIPDAAANGVVIDQNRVTVSRAANPSLCLMQRH